jgi:hypothetical protein
VRKTFHIRKVGVGPLSRKKKKLNFGPATSLGISTSEIHQTQLRRVLSNSNKNSLITYLCTPEMDIQCLGSQQAEIIPRICRSLIQVVGGLLLKEWTWNNTVAQWSHGPALSAER